MVPHFNREPSVTIALLFIALAIGIAWLIVPMAIVLSIHDVPIEHRRRAAWSFVPAYFKSLVILPIKLLAPLVVPLALIGTAWSAERLPRWARWWDNDVGINGDNFPVWFRDPETGLDFPEPVPLEDTPQVRALSYWAKGHHPRSFYARWIWLGLRNRASRLAQMLGRNADYSAPMGVWGETDAGRSREGWYLLENAGTYQFVLTRRFGAFCVRLNYGHKVNFTFMHRTRLPVVAIAFSMPRWKETPIASA